MTVEAVSREPEQGASSFGDELPQGTELLQGQYRITEFLNAGGFGITYLARDSLDRTVVIKECFPSAMCCRRSRSVRVRSRSNQKSFASIVSCFGQEARALARLDHPNIVGVHQVFEDNHTAYMALDLVQGRDLLDVIDYEPDRLSPEAIREILVRLLDAVGYVHDRGILHRDIAPDNILLSDDNIPVLIDFGAAREEATRVSRLLTQQNTVKDGYSPQEFYISGAKQVPSSDLYALAATFYHLITGAPPPVSQQRLAAVAEGNRDPITPLSGTVEGYDRFFLAAIDRCLSIFPKDRIQSARDWQVEIDTERRRQAARERAATDEVMQRRIRRLVTETNKTVERGPVQKPNTRAKPDPRVMIRKTMFADLNEPTDAASPGDADMQATAPGGQDGPVAPAVDAPPPEAMDDAAMDDAAVDAAPPVRRQPTVWRRMFGRPRDPARRMSQ